jgi:hypothetical protein
MTTEKAIPAGARRAESGIELAYTSPFAVPEK